MYEIKNEPVYSSSNRKIYYGNNEKSEEFIFKSLVLDNILSAEHFENEVKLIKNLSSFNLIETTEIYYKNDNVYLVYKKPEEGTLLFREHMDFNTVTELFLQLLHTVKGIHSCGFIHGNLNPNSMFVLNGKLAIYNTGIYISRESNRNYLPSSTLYCSKEKRIDKKLGFSADFYSIGKILLFLFTMEQPIKSIKKDRTIINYLIERFNIDVSLSYNLYEFIIKLIDQDFNKIEEIIDEFNNIVGHYKNIVNNPYCLTRIRLNTFIGRSIELNRITGLFLKEEGFKAIGIKGEIGSGKTALIEQAIFVLDNYSNYKIILDIKKLTEISIVSCFHFLLEELLKTYPQLSNDSTLNTEFSTGFMGPLLPFALKGGDNAFFKLSKEKVKDIINSFFSHPFLKKLNPVIYIKGIELLKKNNRVVLLDVLAMIPVIKGLIIFEDSELDNWNPNETVYVNNFTQEEIKQFIGCRFKLDSSKITQLAGKCYSKTFGNPYYLNEFIENLYHDGIIWKNFKTGMYDLDLTRIDQLKISNNVVKIIKRRIDRLDRSSKELLKIIYCLGREFYLYDIFIILDERKMVLDHIKFFITNEIVYLDEGTVSEYYWIQAKDETINTKLCFSHEKIYKYILSLFSDNEEYRINLDIVNKWYKTFNIEDKKHLNRSNNMLKIIGKIEDIELREFCIDKLILYIEREESKGCYTEVYNYLRVLYKLYKKTMWTDNYYKTINFFNLLVRAAYYTKNFDDIQEYKSIILANINSIADSYTMYSYINYSKFLLKRDRELLFFPYETAENRKRNLRPDKFYDKIYLLLKIRCLKKRKKDLISSSTVDINENIDISTILLDVIILRLYSGKRDYLFQLLKKIYKNLDFKVFSKDTSKFLLLLSLIGLRDLGRYNNTTILYKYSKKLKLITKDNQNPLYYLIAGSVESAFASIKDTIKLLSNSYKLSIETKSYHWAILSANELRIIQLLTSCPLEMVVKSIKKDINYFSKEDLKLQTDRLENILITSLELMGTIGQKDIRGLYTSDNVYKLLLQVTVSYIYRQSDLVALSKELYTYRYLLVTPFLQFLSIYYYTFSLLVDNSQVIKDKILIKKNLKLLKTFITSKSVYYKIKIQFLEGVYKLRFKKSYKGFWLIESAIILSKEHNFYLDTGFISEHLYLLQQEFKCGSINCMSILESHRAFKNWGANKKCLILEKEFKDLFSSGSYLSNEENIKTVYKQGSNRTIIDRGGLTSKIDYEICRYNRFNTLFSIALLEIKYENIIIEDRVKNKIETILLQFTRVIDVIAQEKNIYLLLLPRTDFKGSNTLLKKLETRINKLYLDIEINYEALCYIEGITSEGLIDRLLSICGIFNINKN